MTKIRGLMKKYEKKNPNSIMDILLLSFEGKSK